MFPPYWEGERGALGHGLFGQMHIKLKWVACSSENFTLIH